MAAVEFLQGFDISFLMWLEDKLLNIFSSLLKWCEEDGTAQLDWFRYDVDSDEPRQAFRGLSWGSKIRFEITPSESSSTCGGILNGNGMELGGLKIAFCLAYVMVPVKLVIKSTRTLFVVEGVIVVMNASCKIQMSQMVRWIKLKLNRSGYVRWKISG